MILSELLSYGFFQRALIAGILVAILCSSLGMFLVLRRLSLIGDGLAHLTFGSVAIGMFLRVYPPYMAIPLSLLGSLAIMRIMEKARIYGDSAIGIISSAGIAIGIIITSISGGFNVDLFSYLFGNILTIRKDEIIITLFLTISVLLLIYIFYDELIATSFDEDLAKISGINTKKINNLLILITAFTVVISMRVVGILLVSSFLILPNVSALQIAKNFRSAIFISSSIAILAVVLGIIISFVFNLPASGSIVLVNLVFFILSLTLRRFFLQQH